MSPSVDEDAEQDGSAAGRNVNLPKDSLQNGAAIYREGIAF